MAKKNKKDESKLDALKKYGSRFGTILKDSADSTRSAISGMYNDDGVKRLKNIGKGIHDTGMLMGASGAKAPAYALDFANEIGKDVYDHLGGDKPEDNFIDKYSEKWIKLMDDNAKDQALSDGTRKYYDELSAVTDIVTPSPFAIGSKAKTIDEVKKGETAFKSKKYENMLKDLIKDKQKSKVKTSLLADERQGAISQKDLQSGMSYDDFKARSDKLNAPVSQGTPVTATANGSRRTSADFVDKPLPQGQAVTNPSSLDPAFVSQRSSKETYLEKAQKAFSDFIGKDKKIKKATTELDDLTKRFDKIKADMTPEQLVLMEKHLAGKQSEIDVLMSQGKTKVAQEMKKKIKLDKDIDKIVNPKDPLLGKKTKAAGVIGATGLGGVLATENLIGDEDSTPTITDGPDVPQPGEEGTPPPSDTKGEDKGQETPNTPTPEDVPQPNTKTAATPNNSMVKTSGTLMDDNGNKYPVYLQGGAYKIKGPDGTIHTLITGVTDANRNTKFQSIADNALPF